MRRGTIARRRVRRRVAAFAGALAATLGALSTLPAAAPAQATAQLDAGAYHSCAVLTSAALRCWGFNGDGQLGYGNRSTIGDGEPPAAAGPVSVGAGRTVAAVATGDFHTCALLDNGTIRCWGFGFDGQLGYGNRNNIGDDELPSAVGPVALGARALSVSVGGRHSCAVLEDGNVRCWGEGTFGQLGYGTTNNVGDGGRGQSDTPESAGPVALGTAATAIAAGGRHTCALLAGGTVRCWGYGASGQLGYGTTSFVSAPSQVGDVDLGAGRSATAISAGDEHTCALLDNGTVRCWGSGLDGRLGYGDTDNVGDNELPASAGPVATGGDVVAIGAGGAHTCALLDDGRARCWGAGGEGRLGLAATASVGDDETPAMAAAVDLGAGRTALAITAGQAHSCARLDGGDVRCWGHGQAGRLGICRAANVGDDETPGAVAPIALEAVGVSCATAGPVSAVAASPGAAPIREAAPLPAFDGPASAPPNATAPDGRLAAERRRAADLRRCLARALRRARSRRGAARRSCLRLHGRTPGRVRGVAARALSRTAIVLTFSATGSDGELAPAARSYIVKQSRRPIVGGRAFARAQSLCRGSCRFAGAGVGTRIRLTIGDLRPRTTYHYAVAARDNVSRRPGPRSTTVRVMTR